MVLAPATSIDNGEFLLTLNPHHTLVPFMCAIAPACLPVPPVLVTLSHSGKFDGPKRLRNGILQHLGRVLGGIRAGAWYRHPGLKLGRRGEKSWSLTLFSVGFPTIWRSISAPPTPSSM